MENGKCFLTWCSDPVAKIHEFAESAESNLEPIQHVNQQKPSLGEHLTCFPHRYKFPTVLHCFILFISFEGPLVVFSQSSPSVLWTFVRSMVCKDHLRRIILQLQVSPGRMVAPVSNKFKSLQWIKKPGTFIRWLDVLSQFYHLKHFLNPRREPQLRRKKKVVASGSRMWILSSSANRNVWRENSFLSKLYKR